MISGDVPTHLVVGARAGFLSAVKKVDMPWSKVAMQINMTAKSVDLVDLGAAPMPTNGSTGGDLQDFIEKTRTVKPLDWSIILSISRNAVDDDQTASLLTKVKGAGANFQRHINKRVFQVLNGGDGTTYGTSYDGKNFFSATHADKGAAYSTAQDNAKSLTLSLDNFETVYNVAKLFVDDQGEYFDYGFDLIVAHPNSRRVAAQIIGNPDDYTTGNRANNPYSGLFTPVYSPYMDSTAWVLIASNEEVKPLILAMREQPSLTDSWVDPMTPDGGRYYFKFHARYEVHYGLHYLAIQGKS